MAVTHVLGITYSVEVFWDNVVWTDITDDVRAMTYSSSQRSRLSNTWDPGRATIQLSNTDRKYDPTYTSGTYYGDLKPGRQIRIKIDSTVVWWGVIDRFAIEYIGVNHDSVTTLNCVDSLGEVAYAVVPAGYTPAFQTGEKAADRMGRLDAMSTNTAALGWPGWANNPLDYVAEFTAQETWDNTRDHKIIDELRLIAELEQAPVIASANSHEVVALPRNWFKLYSQSTTVNAWFGDGVLAINDVQVLWDADEIITAVSMTDESDNAVVVIDTAGEADYGTRYPASSISGLPASNVESLQGAANTVIALRSTESFRIDSLVSKPGAVEVAWRDFVKDVVLLQRVNVVYTPTGVGTAIDQDYFIDGFTHAVTPGDWTATYSLWPCAPFDAAMPDDLFIVGSSLVDGSDVVGL